MHIEDLNKYNSAHEKIVNTDDNKKLIFETAVSFLCLKNTDIPADFYQSSDCVKIVDRALNSARLYIDELIDGGKFEEAEKFCKEASSKLAGLDIRGMSTETKKHHEIEMGNFFEIYNYRIIDRKYIYIAKNKIEEIEKKSETKIYEILTIFVTIISIIFAFVNGGVVKVLCFRVPAFILLGITIVGSWWVIKYLNSPK